MKSTNKKAADPRGDDDVLDALHELVRLARARLRQALAGDGEAPNPMEGRALAFFVRRPGGTPGELAQHSGRDKGQVARLIAGLRARGLLEGRPDEADRRVLRLYPTEAAQQLHRQLMARRRRIAAQAAAGLAADERRQLLALLRRMQDNLRAPPG